MGKSQSNMRLKVLAQGFSFLTKAELIANLANPTQSFHFTRPFHLVSVQTTSFFHHVASI